MRSSASGRDPPARSDAPFTRSDVEIWLKAAFRAMPFTPVYAPRGNTLEVAVGEARNQTFDILAFSGTVLGDKSEERHIVLLWARSVATKGDVGGSISEYCREHGLDRSTFDRRRVRACDRIAIAKNAADGRAVPSQTVRKTASRPPNCPR